MPFDIVANAPDYIPRKTGFSFGTTPPIEHMMLNASKPAWLPLGALLVREELISHEQLELALMDQQDTGLRLGELLVQWGWVESAAISKALAEQYEMDFFDLDAAEIDPAAVQRLPPATPAPTTRFRSRTWRTAACSSASPTRRTWAVATSFA